STRQDLPSSLSQARSPCSWLPLPSPESGKVSTWRLIWHWPQQYYRRGARKQRKTWASSTSPTRCRSRWLRQLPRSFWLLVEATITRRSSRRQPSSRCLVLWLFNRSRESDERLTRSERTWQESQHVLEVLSIRFPSVALQGKAAFHAVPSEREVDCALTVL